MLRAVKVAGYLVVVSVVVAEVVLAATVAVASHVGYRCLIITGGSMEPTYGVGSALVLRTVPPSQIVTGKVITFSSPAGVLTTHRVVDRVVLKRHTYVQTQGDANPVPDADFTPVDAVVGVPVLAVPMGGYVASFALGPLGRFAILGPPLALLLFIELRLLAGRFRAMGSRGDLGGKRGGRTATVPLLLVVVVGVSMVAGTLLARSTATFVSTSTGSGNTFGSSTLVGPTGLSAGVAGTTANLTWTPTVSTVATGYEVLRGTAAGGPYILIAQVAGRTTGSFSDTTANGIVYYVVRATVGNWTSGNSNEVSVTVVSTAATSTAWFNCAGNAADTGGDGDGYQSNPANACGNANTVYATDAQSGTNGSLSCADTGKDRHRFYNFAVTVPGTATIGGIEVRTVGLHDLSGSAVLCAQLSGDAGATWTSLKSATYPTVGGAATLTMGGISDLWGAAWTPTKLNDTNFRVRIVDVGDSGARTFSLDSVQVRVTYK